MKYIVNITINKPLKEVVDKLMDDTFAHEWLPSLKSIKLLKGKTGEIGAKKEFVFIENGKEMSIIEDATLVKIEKDEAQYNATYTTSGMINHVENYLAEENDTTKLKTVSEFISDKLTYKLMFVFMKFMFVKRTKDDYGRFKNAIENL